MELAFGCVKYNYNSSYLLYSEYYKEQFMCFKSGETIIVYRSRYGETTLYMDWTMTQAIQQYKAYIKAGQYTKLSHRELGRYENCNHNTIYEFKQIENMYLYNNSTVYSIIPVVLLIFIYVFCVVSDA